MPDLKRASEPFLPDMTRLRVGDLNALREAVPLEIQGAGPVLVQKYGQRILAAFAEEFRERFPRLQFFAIRTEYDDYVLCSPFFFEEAPPQIHNPNIDSNLDPKDLVYVAKSHTLQKTPWHNQVVNGVTYNYTDGAQALPPGQRYAGTILQQIDPPYFQGDILLAYRTATGLTITKDVVVNFGVEGLTIINGLIFIECSLADGLIQNNTQVTISGLTFAGGAPDILQTLNGNWTALVGANVSGGFFLQGSAGIAVLLQDYLDNNSGVSPWLSTGSFQFIITNVKVPVQWTDVNTAGRDWIAEAGGVSGVVWPRTVLLQPQEMTDSGISQGTNIDNHGVSFEGHNMRIPELNRDFQIKWYTGYFPGAMVEPPMLRHDITTGYIVPNIFYAFPYLFHENMDITTLAFFNPADASSFSVGGAEYVGVYANLGETDYGYYYPGTLLGSCQPTREFLYKPTNWNYGAGTFNNFLGYRMYYDDVNIRVSGNQLVWFVFRGARNPPPGYMPRVFGVPSGYSSGGAPGLRPIHGMILNNIIIAHLQGVPAGWDYTGQSAVMGGSMLWFFGQEVAPGLPNTFPKTSDFPNFDPNTAPSPSPYLAHTYPWEVISSPNLATLPICFFTFRKP